MSQKVVSYREEPASQAAPAPKPERELRPLSPTAYSRGLRIRRMLTGLTPAPSTLHWVTATSRTAATPAPGGVENYRAKPDPNKRKILKRTLDIAGASAGIVVLLPLFTAIAVAIKANSQGPVVFRQVRHGKDGKPFEIYKFRSMYVEKCDPSGVRQTVANDPRVTPVGDFLRRSNFDELPQLFNVLRGEMSLVGPRPHVPGMIAAGVPYEEFDVRYMDRHKVKPGITGLAQVNGYRGETKLRRAAQMRLEYDLAYVEWQSFRLDVKILIQTVVREFFKRKGSGY